MLKFLSRYKLLVYSLATIFLCAFVAITMVYFFIKNNLYQTEINNYRDSVFVKSEEIRVTLNSANYVAETLKNNIALKNYLSTVEKKLQDGEILKELKVHNIADVFSAIYLMDVDGNTLVSTDQSFVGNNYAFRDYFREAIESGNSFDVVVGVTSQELGYYFSTLLSDNSGVPLGVVVLKLKPEIISQKMNFVKEGIDTRLMLADKYSVVIYSNRLERLYDSVFVLGEKEKNEIVSKKRFIDKNIDNISTWDFANFVGSETSNVTIIQDSNKNIYYKKIGDYNLFLFVEESVHSQLSNILAISQKTVGIVSIIALLSAIIIFFIIKNYLRPIVLLYDAALSVSRGHYDYSIDYNSKFVEMQELLLAFNMMASSVKKAHDDVEKKVQEQTQKIIEKQVFLEEQKKALINVLEDVKDEKKKSDDLTKELEKFKFAVDNASDHIVITDPDAKILYANKAVTRITGYKVDDVLGEKAGVLWGNLMKKDFYKKLWNIIKKEKKSFAGEIVNKRKNGEEYPAEVSITPLIDKKNNVKYFLGIERDITRRKKDEEKLQVVLRGLKEQDYKLAEEKAKYEALLASISSGIIVTDEKGKVILVNKATEEMLGKISKDIKGKQIYSVLEVFDSKGKALNKKIRPIYRALSSGERQTSLLGQDYYYKHADGSLFPVGLMVSPFVWMEKTIGAIIVFRDISYEQSIDKAKTEFVSLASHQLRTPLSTINWYVEMLLDGDAGSLTDEQRQYLEEVEIGNKRMVDLVNSLLNVSRIELGTFAIDPEKIDLRDITDSVLKELQPQIKEKKMMIVKSYSKLLNKINLDSKLIRMVFQNLLTNAIKYTPPKGTIKISIKKNKEDVLVSVSDNGYGIPKKQQENIFTKMFRADNVKLRDTTGTGLGLYIVKSIIEQSAEGNIWFESKENKGTTFYFTIPLISNS